MKRMAMKALIVIAVIVTVGFLFVRSLQTTRSEPYTIAPSHLQRWTLHLEPGNAPASVLIGMRPPRELAATLFRQLFTRHAESFNGQAVPSLPLVLQDEFTRSFAGRATAEELLAAARGAGLEQASFEPRCMGYRRDSAPGVTRQLYFAAFTAPAFTRFREQIATVAIPNSGFVPSALSPVVLVAASDANFNQWLPIRVEDGDCVAPISVESGRQDG
jgi:hypothetical protein